MKNSKAGFGFIEIILVMAMVLFLFFKLADVYFKKPALDVNTQKAAVEQGIDTSNYKSIIDSTKKKVEDIQVQHFNELNNVK